jgi:Arc/MetJ-type ribon-helix-helix transcriptional regulator
MARHSRYTTLSISMPLELAQAVFAEVRSGRFDTESGVVCEALRRMLEGDGDADAQTSADDEDDGSSRRRKPPRASS